jgi:two-component system CheB/CheR fusion protein
MGYSQGIKELLINLLNNAIDATIAGGNIEVSTDIRDGSHVILKVADDGAGIPEENIERIYDPFFTTKRNDRGIGLGLAICLRLIKRHNGLIEVNSEEGKGTTFTASFPIY